MLSGLYAELASAPSASQLLAYGLLMAALASCFLPSALLRLRPAAILNHHMVNGERAILALPMGLAVLAIVAASAAHVLHAAAWPSVLLLALLVAARYIGLWSAVARPRCNAAVQVLAVLMALAFALHGLPGFTNLLLLNQVSVSSDAIPYTLYANFDKGLAALLLFWVLWPQGQPASKTSFAGWWWLVPLTVLCCLVLAMQLGLIRWQPKWPSYSLWFLLCNGFLTCIAEELLFRGVIQQQLAKLALRFKPDWAQQRLPAQCWTMLPILLTAVLFGVAHFAGGLNYVAVATVAGVGYGLLYARSGRIGPAILGHFAVNATHFVFFTYPMLST